jgi:hypothetical protein
MESMRAADGTGVIIPVIFVIFIIFIGVFMFMFKGVVAPLLMFDIFAFTIGMFIGVCIDCLGLVCESLFGMFDMIHEISDSSADEDMDEDIDIPFMLEIPANE